MRQFTFQIETPPRIGAPPPPPLDDGATSRGVFFAIRALFLLAAGTCVVAILLYSPFREAVNDLWIRVRDFVLL